MISRFNVFIKLTIIITIILSSSGTKAQLADSCKLEIGVNLNGISDYGTEIPFVNLMRVCRTWYTKSIGDLTYPFDSGYGDELTYRADGYPTHIPQSIGGSTYDQETATIWGLTDAWPTGEYTVLWEGDGTLDFYGVFTNLQNINSNKITFDVTNPIGGTVEMIITSSNVSDPIHNIRVLMPGTEFTYEEEPFYSVWVDKVSVFNTTRFMDWGSTNGWGRDEDEGYGSDTLVEWAERSKMEYYTWTHNKGIPYEMMVKYMNDYDKDGWVCVPHSVSEDYTRKMAQYFRDSLETDRHIFAEYSNEIWNFIFPQAQWANEYGCEEPGTPWPEGTTQYVERTLDYWTQEFVGHEDRTTRVVGIFTGWLDIAQRVAFNIDTSMFDVISPTFYFGINEDYELELDTLGVAATVADVVNYTNQSMSTYFSDIVNIKNLVADSLNKPMAFYEGGQHMTPNPFGVMPSYEQAFRDVHRDDEMYLMYNRWFDSLRTLQTGNDPMLLMHFSFVAPLNAQYGSWGILETMDQDTTLVSAPKYRSVIENMNASCSAGDNSSADGDSDGIDDDIDNCPTINNPLQDDYDNDGIGDLCDIPDVGVIVEGGLLHTLNQEGILMMGRDSTCYLLYIDTGGSLTTEQRPCPPE